VARSEIVGLTVSPEARESVRSLTYELTGQIGRRVTMSEAMVAACSVASANLAATVETLTGNDR
jgi:hypothetical protein